MDIQHKKISEQLIKACEQGDYYGAKNALNQYVDIDGLNENGMHALSIAAQNGHDDIIQFLHDNGADIRRHDRNGLSALFHAVDKGHIKSVKILIERGADIGPAILNIAQERGKEDIVNYLTKVKKGFMEKEEPEKILEATIITSSEHASILKAQESFVGFLKKGMGLLNKLGDIVRLNSGYFEESVPSGGGICSDNECPCSPSTVIPRGSGYLYIEEYIVEWRRRYPRLKDANEAMGKAMLKDLSEKNKHWLDAGIDVSGTFRTGPIFVCERGAKLRNLDLEVAAADAKHWWKTGQVPLRATPKRN